MHSTRKLEIWRNARRRSALQTAPKDRLESLQIVLREAHQNVPIRNNPHRLFCATYARFYSDSCPD